MEEREMSDPEAGTVVEWLVTGTNPPGYPNPYVWRTEDLKTLRFLIEPGSVFLRSVKKVQVRRREVTRSPWEVMDLATACAEVAALLVPPSDGTQE